MRHDRVETRQGASKTPESRPENAGGNFQPSQSLNPDAKRPRERRHLERARES
jgi:hypothetical protein